MIPTSPERLFHYSSEIHLSAIIQAGTIAVTRLLTERGERPAAWFSFASDYEECCCVRRVVFSNAEAEALCRRPGGGLMVPPSMLQDGTATMVPVTRVQVMAATGGLARIEIRPAAAPHRYADFFNLSGVSAAARRAMTAADRRMRSQTALWRASFSPVTVADWLAIEVDTGNGWHPLAAERPDLAATLRTLHGWPTSP